MATACELCFFRVTRSATGREYDFRVSFNSLPLSFPEHKKTFAITSIDLFLLNYAAEFLIMKTIEKGMAGFQRVFAFAAKIGTLEGKS